MSTESKVGCSADMSFVKMVRQLSLRGKVLVSALLTFFVGIPLVAVWSSLAVIPTLGLIVACPIILWICIQVMRKCYKKGDVIGWILLLVVEILLLVLMYNSHDLSAGLAKKLRSLLEILPKGIWGIICWAGKALVIFFHHAFFGNV